MRQLQAEIDECNIQKTRAAKLLNSLAGEKQKWTVLNNVVDKKFDTLEGDCLLGAALMTYLGQLTSKFRDDFFYRWLEEIRERSSLQIAEYYDFIKMFGNQVQIKRWIINKLPSDTFSITNGLIIEKCPIQTIMIDPQYQANNWLKENCNDIDEEDDDE